MVARRKPLVPKAGITKNGKRRYGCGGKVVKSNTFKCGGKIKK